MIITQTPYRVGLCGGGTDLPSYYRDHGGAVLNLALDKYFYVSICRRFDNDLRVAYSQTEYARRSEEVRHDIVRTALRRLGIRAPVEISMTGEVPAGTGLGSSSAVAVGVLNALTSAIGEALAPVALAEMACCLELDWLGRAMGRQDQYGCAIGGVKLLEFHPDDSVTVTKVELPALHSENLVRHALMLYIGRRKSNADILQHQIDRSGRNAAPLHRMKATARELAEALAAGADIREVAALIDEGWQLKRELSNRISTSPIDGLYAEARRLGAWGGKLLGAGKSGFLFLLAPPERHGDLRALTRDGQVLAFGISEHGSRVVFHKPMTLEREECHVG